MDWATKRKLQYFLIIVSLILVFFVLPFYLWIYKPPTCFDGRKNGDETGIDCGGSCRLVCSAEAISPILRWEPRIFKVSNDFYSLLAYVENPNAAAEALNAPYTFKIYDAEGILILERAGTTSIPRAKSFAIFDGNFSLGNRTPAKVVFEFGNLTWTRTTEEDPDIKIESSALMREESAPRVEATVTNESVLDVNNLELVSVVFDSAGNAIAASRTFLPTLPKNQSQDVVFTWPNPFETKAQVCENPVDVVLSIDRSGSMDDLGNNPPQPLTDVKNAAVYFANLLHENDQLGVVTFANDGTADYKLNSEIERAKSSIDKISILTSGTQNTNIADGLKKAQAELLSTKARNDAEKIVVLLTDGVTTLPTKKGDADYPETYAKQIADDLRRSNIGVFSIGLGKEIDSEFLKSISGSSDKFFLAPTTKELREIYKNIATEICTKKPAVIEIIPHFYKK